MFAGLVVDFTLPLPQAPGVGLSVVQGGLKCAKIEVCGQFMMANWQAL